MRARFSGDQAEGRCEHGGQCVAEQDDVEDIPAHSLIEEERVLVEYQPDDDHRERKSGNELRRHVMHDRLRAPANALKPDRHREAAARLQCVFGQGRGAVIDVAAIHIVADFEKHGQHGEQDRAGIDHARGKIVGTAAQQPARDPERDRRNAIAVEDPVEDWRGAHVRDDARLVRDAHNDQPNQNAAHPAQPRQRALLRHPGGARHHQGERDREPAFLQREGERERECCDRAGGKNGSRRREAGARLAF